MEARSFHVTVQGASHKKVDKECQDSSRSIDNERYSLAIVCDGHGGDDYVRSAVGSACACDAAEQNIRFFLENVNVDELKNHSATLLKQLEASIITDWNKLIHAHYDGHPFLESEISVMSDRAKNKYLQEKHIESAYGTTLIAVAVTADYWFGIQIGDGKCVAVSRNGDFTQPIPWNDKCFLNVTTSICGFEALADFREYYSDTPPAAVFIGSDGIDDCFINDQQLYVLYNTVMYLFSSQEFDATVSELNDYLPRLSAKGSGDDMSIAAVIHVNDISKLESVRNFDPDKEKSRQKQKADTEVADEAKVEEDGHSASETEMPNQEAITDQETRINTEIPESSQELPPDRVASFEDEDGAETPLSSSNKAKGKKVVPKLFAGFRMRKKKRK